MSNLMINWRFWTYHLQVVRFSDWSSYLRSAHPIVTWTRNLRHAPGGLSRGAGWRPVEFYTGRGYAFALAALLAMIVIIAA